MKPFIQTVTQRQTHDCAVAVIAMLFDLNYEQAFMQFRGSVWKEGASNRQITNVCKRLGWKTSWKLKPDIENDTGLLFVSFSKNPTELRHVVLLDEGRIFDTDGMVWDAEFFLSVKEATPGEVLIVAGKLEEN